MERETLERDQDDVRPLAGNRLIGADVGAGGANASRDVGAVQTALARHGFEPAGGVDRRIGPNTISAIRRFQRTFMRHPDGLVEAGKVTEQHLVSSTTPRPPQREDAEADAADDGGFEETVRATADAVAQMSRLESVADNVAGRRPGGMCYRAVKQHIANAGGYDNIRNIYTDRRFAGAQGEARDFADVVNQNPGRFGLERLSISNPYDAPLGALVVVGPGSPGTSHPTAGDITVKGPGEAFYNDGNMSYRGRTAWPPRRGGVLGVYRPK